MLCDDFEKKQSISPIELKPLFDDIVLELKPLFDDIVLELNDNPAINNRCQIVHALKSVRGLTMIGPLIADHELYHILRNTLSDILNKWRHKNNSLSDQNEYLFAQISDLFLKMINHLKHTNGSPLSTFKTWLLNEIFM
ncbi:unnamed protein product [Didymodactylos carnosus]|uniref:Uncharacterized protein n=1 Tax=Didymodactylos carnosus TaxID=1234261 RepID=A0A815S5F0_9BILA|nr:unnamed protein product [Didymodactylos carnosus]CAF4351444.1 unnamed protein product [Didymodactylos carnosus]